MISMIEAKNSKKLAQELSQIFNNATREINVLADQTPDQIVESVHLIRKRLKFLRAFVKLTRFCTCEEYKSINYILRDSGRTICDCRDAHVRGLLLADFAQNGLKKNLLDELNTINDSVTNDIETSLLTGKSVFNEVISDISSEEINEYFESLEPDTNCLISGLTLGYEKSYRAFHSELKSHEADLLHEWRKRTKDLQYQFEALLDSIPNQLSPSYDEIVGLCEMLGRINDLFMFLDWLELIEDSITPKNQLTELRNKLHTEHKNLVSQANKLGHSLFVMTPNEFSQSLSKEMNV